MEMKRDRNVDGEIVPDGRRQICFAMLTGLQGGSQVSLHHPANGYTVEPQ